MKTYDFDQFETLTLTVLLMSYLCFKPEIESIIKLPMKTKEIFDLRISCLHNQNVEMQSTFSQNVLF